MMSALTFGVLSFSSLLTIIDPIAAAPLFVALTDGADAERRPPPCQMTSILKRTPARNTRPSVSYLPMFVVGSS